MGGAVAGTRRAVIALLLCAYTVVVVRGHRFGPCTVARAWRLLGGL
ncbi:hypothetical protein NO263_09240 [Gluconacetobacter entanii]|uniref:Uncharacterized protein n=1 Tax=Gluconacetobacter entanii TaxID=108528 RepID=A0ABT3K5T1_9PROT|nr:hypothetical protein [Gluconacetobacter entanii]MCW4590765.1 hypothetical protein [Gluconacetobacter entanii]MCW4594234.1 hypothetical protein [Gluconacetobacter entanii]NPC89010.1 hypothetical protein [Gluconacetobacter entanii]